MHIFNYLKNDHRKVVKLLNAITITDDMTEQKNLFLEVKKELELHANTEEKTFYQAISRNQQGKKIIQHAKEEHSAMKSAIKKIDKIDQHDTKIWFMQLGELKYILEHHIKEEEKKIFKIAKKIISNKKSLSLCEEMQALKEKMMESVKFKKKFNHL